MKTPFNKLEIKSFDSEEACLKLIADQKWAEGYTCRKCGNINFCKGKTPDSRRCTRCKHEESATSHTIFHRCRVPLPEAFRIMYMVCNNPGISTYELSRQLELRQMTCWKLKSKLIQCIEKKGEIDICTYLPSGQKKVSMSKSIKEQNISS
jgi:two-component system, sensor histidine kinase LadS